VSVASAARVSDDASTKRWLALASLLDWAGTGSWITVSAIYFTRVVGLSGQQVGLGMTLGGLVGLAAVVPVSASARRWPVRPLSVSVHAFRGVAVAGYLLVNSFPGFVLVTCLTALGDRPAASLNQIVVARALSAESRASAMAMLHVTINVGITTGAALGGLTLLSGSGAGYGVVILGNAASSVLASVAIALMPASPVDLPADDSTERKPVILDVLRDRRYVAATAGLGLLALHVPLLNVAVPLWTVRHTNIPVAIVGPLFVLNTVLVVALQVPVSRWARDIARGRQVAVGAGAALVGAATCLAAAARTGLVGALALTVAGVVLLTLGEIGHGAAAWTLSFGLAPDDHRQPAYLGCFGMGTASATVLGPSLLTALVLGLGGVGWMLLAGLIGVGVAVVWASVPTRQARHAASRSGLLS